MPEGPSLYILRQELDQFAGKRVQHISGNQKDKRIEALENKVVKSFKTWGKHLLICFDKETIKIHLLLFGSYLINEDKDAKVRLNLTFNSGFVNFYACQVKLLEDKPNNIYDWSADVMNKKWSAAKALEKLRAHPDQMICDLLLNQEIFAGVGNIIKNEVLFRAGVQPESKAGDIPDAKLRKIIKEAKKYAFEFLEQKQEGTLKKNWQVHTKKTCKKCKNPITRKVTGKSKRRSFYCMYDQELF